MSKAHQVATSKEVATDYEPTALEREAVDTFFTQRNKRVQTPRLRVATNAGGGQQLALDHPDPGVASAILMNALGTTDFDFYDGLLAQLANVGAKGQKVDEVALNFMRSVIAGLEPKDQLEAMLAAQMAAVHLATMTFARRLNHVDNIQQQDSAERTFNKLARTFAVQMETLKRYRTGGQQRVTVEHVTVNEGGQAIVGSVSTGGGVIRKSEERPHARSITHAPGQALPSDFKAVPETVSSASR